VAHAASKVKEHLVGKSSSAKEEITKDVIDDFVSSPATLKKEGWTPEIAKLKAEYYYTHHDSFLKLKKEVESKAKDNKQTPEDSKASAKSSTQHPAAEVEVKHTSKAEPVKQPAVKAAETPKLPQKAATQGTTSAGKVVSQVHVAAEEGKTWTKANVQHLCIYTVLIAMLVGISVLLHFVLRRRRSQLEQQYEQITVSRLPKLPPASAEDQV